MTFLETWGLSLLLEYPVLMFVLFTSTNWKRILPAALAATTLTLPWLWFVLPDWFAGQTLLIVGQLGAVLVETLLLMSWLQMDWRRCLIAAVLANLCSFFLASYLLTWWSELTLSTI